ncbi:MAG TPA: DUF3810 domain-containing protein [Eubacteriales bacterium]|nr:DUF3810 domain-containing protein [Eubacteriales bacterium]
MRKFLGKIFNKNNIVFFAIFILTAVFVILANSSAARLLTPVNEFFIRILGWLNSLIPVSFLGILSVAAIPLLVLIIWLLVLSKRKLRFLITLISIACVCLVLFYCVIGFNYSKESIYDTMDLTLSEDDSAFIEEAARYYLTELNNAAENVTFTDGHSVMNLSFSQMSENILDTYKNIEIFDFLYDFDLMPKQYFPALIMNYSGTTGMFFPFFAEINVCANIPDRDLPTTTAHEIAHSKGIMNEGECNFIADIICINSDNDYVRYSGLSVIFARLVNEIYKTDTDLYHELLSELNPSVLADYAYANEFYDSYEGIISRISDKINDIYLKSNNVSGGVISYSQAVKGILAYYREYVNYVDNR